MQQHPVEMAACFPVCLRLRARKSFPEGFQQTSPQVSLTELACVPTPNLPLAGQEDLIPLAHDSLGVYL